MPFRPDNKGRKRSTKIAYTTNKIFIRIQKYENVSDPKPRPPISEWRGCSKNKQQKVMNSSVYKHAIQSRLLQYHKVINANLGSSLNPLKWTSLRLTYLQSRFKRCTFSITRIKSLLCQIDIPHPKLECGNRIQLGDKATTILYFNKGINLCALFKYLKL